MLALASQAPGYSKVIARPMDFTTMWARFQAGAYADWDALRADLDLIFTNSMAFNRPETIYHREVAPPNGCPHGLL